LVTGASRGIGAVVACRLAEAGARVGVNYHASPDAATVVVDNISQAGGEAFLVGGDVSQEEKAQAVIKQVVEHFGSIDLLVNNAGINKDQLLIRMKPEDFDSVINVNLRGAFLCTKITVELPFNDFDFLNFKCAESVIQISFNSLCCQHCVHLQFTILDFESRDTEYINKKVSGD